MSCADVVKLVDTLDLGSSGRPWGFESLHPHQKRAKSKPIWLFLFVRVAGLEP